jgi:hypothetical protein
MIKVRFKAKLKEYFLELFLRICIKVNFNPISYKSKY